FSHSDRSGRNRHRIGNRVSELLYVPCSQTNFIQLVHSKMRTVRLARMSQTTSTNRTGCSQPGHMCGSTEDLVSVGVIRRSLRSNGESIATDRVRSFAQI